MNRFSQIFALCALLSLAACYDSRTELHVIPSDDGTVFMLKDQFGKFRRIEAGAHKARIELSSTRATLVFPGRDYPRDPQDAVKFRFNIPSRDEFLYSNAPLAISAAFSGQPVNLVVARDVEKEFDRINVSLYNEEDTKLIATAQLINKNGSDKRSFDEEKGEFLSSYQKVKMSQRALVFEINGAVDDMFWMVGGVENALDNIVNYGAAAYIAPWAYARYYKVNWILSDGSDSSDYQKEKWQNALRSAPVVDYVSWVHEGDQYVNRSWLEGKKEHQLRMVYIGACNSGASVSFIREQNAAVTSGHRGLSASPLFQFSIFRNWAYGRSYRSAVQKGWFWGKAKAKVLEYATFANFWAEKTGLGMWDDVDDMLQSSEPLLAYTADLHARDVSVGLSTVRKSSTEKRNRLEVIVEAASKID